MAVPAPWPAKILAKLVLTHAPIPYRVWASLGIFKHGKMATLDYPKKIFGIHQKVAADAGLDYRDAVVLELGTGDSVASALLAHAAGVKKTYLVDVADFATRDMAFYRAFAASVGIDLTDVETFEAMLERINAVQLTNGLASWSEIDAGSVDFLWSHSTIEHVRKGEFAATVTQMWRVLKPGGKASHNIDLQDHLNYALNNLRFGEKLWEADWWAKSGFYTNRLRRSDLIDLFAAPGFDVEVLGAGHWDAIPTPRQAMAAPFRDMSDDDLTTRTLSVLLHKPTK